MKTRRSVTRRDIMRLLKLIDGSLGPRSAARMERRLAEDAPLARAHRRLLGVRQELTEIRQSSAPELPYRQIEAQVRWRGGRGAESPTAPQATRRRPVTLAPILALTGAAILGGICSLGAYHIAMMIANADSLVDKPARSRSTIQTILPHSDEIAALATLVSGDVTIAAAGGSLTALDLNRPLLVGERIITGAGAVAALQWGQDTGVALEDQTEMELRQLDTSRQVLVLWKGRMVAQVKPAARQRLSVVAGPLRVDVTGTYFAVSNDGGVIEVDVFRGAVHVFDQGHDRRLPAKGIALPAGLRLRVAQSPQSPPKPQPLGEAIRGRIHLQPWHSLHRVLAETGVLTVESDPPGATMRLDTVEIGHTDLTLRGAAGRHLVELMRDGELLRREWVVFRPSTRERLALDVRPPAPRPKLATLPKGIYETFRWRAREIRGCYERRLKRNPELRGKLVVRLAIDNTGDVQRANLDKDSLGDPEVGSCALRAVKRWRFPPHNPLEIVYPFDFQPAR